MGTQATLTTVTSIFLMLLVGYGAKRFGMLKADDAGILNTIVMNISLPSFIFVSIHGKAMPEGVAKAPMLGLVTVGISIGLSYLAARALRLDRPTTGALMLTSTFGNTAFLGYPVIVAAFGGDKEAIFAGVIFDEFGRSLPMYSVGAAIACCFAGARFELGSLLGFLKNPLMPAAIIGLLLRTTPIPTVLMTTLGLLAASTVPVSMLSLGLSLSSRAVKTQPTAIMVAFALKMILMPALLYFALPLIGVTGKTAQVAVLLSAMPPAVFTSVIAANYGSNGPFAAATVSLLTLVSVLWIPGVLMLIR